MLDFDCGSIPGHEDEMAERRRRDCSRWLEDDLRTFNLTAGPVS
jgi:hypothetical protein